MRFTRRCGTPSFMVEEEEVEEVEEEVPFRCCICSTRLGSPRRVMLPLQ